METVFDHDLTPNEQRRFAYLKNTPPCVSLSLEDCHLAALGHLFADRGDDQAAERYWSRIADEETRRGLLEQLPPYDVVVHDLTP